MKKLLMLPAGPRSKWVVLAIWIAAIFAVSGAQLPTKFEDIQKNDSASFLPGDAESTKALAKTEELQGAENVTIVAVYRREGGLTGADKAQIAEDRERLNALNLPATKPFGEPELSRDGSSALLLADIATDGEADTILDPVEDVREEISTDGSGGSGLQVKVTGSAGFSADAIKVFENINGTLLLAAVALVFLLLALIYRSPLFLWIPLITVGFAEIMARSFGWAAGELLGVTVNGQSASIMSILVLGAGTDYALLLVARYREELRRHQDKHRALAESLTASGPAITASALTVVLALICLAVAEVNGTAGLGPLGAIGVLTAMVAMLTLLPALLGIFGRRAFWPFVPYGPDGADAPDATPKPSRVPATVGFVLAMLLNVGVLVGVLAALGVPAPATLAVIAVAAILLRVFGGPFKARFAQAEHRFSDEAKQVDATHGRWRAWGEWIARRPRRVWIVTTLILGVMSLGLLSYSNGLTQGNSFRGEVESVQGQELLSKGFPSGQNAPTDVIVPDAAKVAAVTAALEGTDGVANVREVTEGPPGTYLQVALEPDPYSTEAFDLIPVLRDAVKEAGGEDVLVGGTTAIERDLRAASVRDNRVIIPLVLLVVFIVLILLLRALAAPLILMATVVLSFAAALGVSYVAFDLLFDFPGSDPSLPLFAFVFLVALGIDYNIFLMARVREETARYGTRQGMLRGLAVTGGVITSAGIVLAGTFAVLAVLPLVPLTQIGFAVAFGVLLDTFVVRSTLVPALVFDIGRKVWWPSRLAHEGDPGGLVPEDEPRDEQPAPPAPAPAG
ncbi:MAG: MMPL family transporter [Solirubrobacteraceae bacterium]|jgi:RND superfamily putative drug exporter|nr:MMPL family transporter [Solirubrobacteraceae bacterium]